MRCKNTEEAQRIVAMSQSAGWQVFVEVIKEEIAILIETLITTGNSEPQHIVKLQSQIRALRSVIAFVDERHKRLEKGGF